MKASARTLIALAILVPIGLAAGRQSAVDHDAPRLQQSSSCQIGWLPFGAGNGTDDWIVSLEVFDDGNGPALFAGGKFMNAGGIPAPYIAKWDGSVWSSLGNGLPSEVLSMTVFDDGNGEALYAGGFPFLSKWDGAAWTDIGTGTMGYVKALTVFDDGSGGGPALYGAGESVEKWDGSSWTPISEVFVFPRVTALGVFDDGSGGGPCLYAGGTFPFIGGVAAKRIARWDGSSWSAVGNGLPSGSLPLALKAFDDGSGPALFAALITTNATGGVRKWDGSSWSGYLPGITRQSHDLACIRRWHSSVSVRGYGTTAWPGGTARFGRCSRAGRTSASRPWRSSTRRTGVAPASTPVGFFTGLGGGGTSERIAKWGCPAPGEVLYCTAKTGLGLWHARDVGRRPAEHIADQWLPRPRGSGPLQQVGLDPLHQLRAREPPVSGRNIVRQHVTAAPRPGRRLRWNPWMRR